MADGGTRRRADIQGMRALAVGLVVAFHAGLPIPGGFIGVDVFFVISGFVIAQMLLAELDSTGTVALRSFYLRRFRRILPALALMLVVGLALSLLLVPLAVQDLAAKTGAAASLSVANIFLYRYGAGGYFAAAATDNPFLHTWSLSVEEQFYLLFPALLMVGWRLRGRERDSARSRRSVGAVVTALVAVSFALSYLLTFDKLPGLELQASLAFYMAPTRAWEFGVGVLLAIGAASFERLPRSVALVLGPVGLAAIAYGAFAFDESTPFPGAAALAPVLGTALLIAAGIRRSTGLNRLLASRPTAWIGDLSYSWYLWHWPLIVFAGFLWPGHPSALVIAAVVSFLPAWLSFRYLERPIRLDKAAPPRRTLRLAGACALLPIVFAIALVGGNRAVRRTTPIEDFTRETAFHADTVRGCEGIVFDAPDHPCRVTVPGAKGTVVLVGDSNAGQFTEPFTKGANAAGYTAVTNTLRGCPFTQLDVTRRGREDEAPTCHAFRHDTMAALAADPPEVVVIANFSEEMIPNRTGEYRFEDPGSDAPTRTVAERQRAWADGLASVAAPMLEAGTRVIVVEPVPKFGDTDVADCPPAAIFANRCTGESRSLERIDAYRATSVGAIADAVAAAPGIETVDFTEDLCSPTACATARDGILLWRDGLHLSVAGAETLTPRFREVIAG